MALKFSQHFLWIASAMGHVGGETTACGMTRTASSTTSSGCPTARRGRLKVRSMVGLLPLCAATVFEGELLTKSPELVDRLYWFLAGRPELYATIHDPMKPGVGGRRLAAILDENGLRRVLAKMLDENEFLSPFGIRSLSRYHADHPYVIQAGGQEYRVGIVRCMEAPVSSRRTGTGTIASCSTSTSTATTRAGLGTRRQTGWTRVIARSLHLFATMTPPTALHSGKQAVLENALAASGV